jgi:WD40 repeat protein
MNNDPPCTAWAEKLALRREDLSQSEREALDTHVAECSACRQTQADYDLLSSALKTLPNPTCISSPRHSFWGNERDSYEGENREEAYFLPRPHHASFEALDPPSWQVHSNRRSAKENLFRKHARKFLLAVATICVVISFVLLVNMYSAVMNVLHSSGTGVGAGKLIYWQQHYDSVNAVVWSPDGNYIATGMGEQDHTVQVWNTKSGLLQATYTGHSELIDALAWSPDGKYIASGSWDHTVQVWNALTGKPVFTYQEHSGAVSTLVWLPDNNHIASGSWDHTVQIWNAFTGVPLDQVRNKEFVNALARSPDGSEIAFGGSDTKIHIWNPQTREIQDCSYEMGTAVDALAWSPDGKYIAIGGRDGTVQVRDSSNCEQQLLTYLGHTKDVDALAWSPDGKYIASGSYDFTVKIWDAKTAVTLLTYKGHSDIVNGLAWSPDGKQIVSGSYDHTVQIWNTGVS